MTNLEEVPDTLSDVTKDRLQKRCACGYTFRSVGQGK